MNAGDITICVVHRNTPEWLGAALRRLAAHTDPRPRVVVVDNGSNAEAAKEAASLCKSSGADMLTLPSAVAHGAAIDAAVPKVRTKWMLVLDSDAFPVSDGWLDGLASMAGDDVAAVGASAGMSHAENPFGNYVHPSMCLVNVGFLRKSAAAFRDAWPKWDTGEQVTMEAMRLGWQVRYVHATHFDLFGHGVLLGGRVFHAYYGTRVKTASAEELARVDGVDAKLLRAEHRRLLDAEAAMESGGSDPFAAIVEEANPDGPELSVIIPFRQRGSITSQNLQAVVASLNAQTLERNRYEIVIVEAAPAPSLQDPPPGCRLVFAYCPDALFRKSWAMNVGFRRAAGAVLLFHDADVLAPDTMLEAVMDRLARGSQVAKPSYSVLDLSREWAEKAHSQGPATLMRKMPAAAQRLRNAPGGSIAVTRKQFAAMCGYNEQFVGWGGEDDEFLLRLRALGHDPPDLDCKLYHLWHEQGPIDQKQVAANRRLVEHVRRLSRRAVRRYTGAMPEGYGDANAFRRRPSLQIKDPGPSVLLAGAYSGYGPDANVGDDATRDVLTAILKRKGCSVRISPKHPCTENHMVGTDMVVVGGGGIIADHSEDAFYNYMSYLKHAAAKGVPVGMLGIGVCSLKHKRRRISGLMRGASAVCLRDELSRGHLEDGQFAEVAADLGWLLKPARRPIVALGKETVGVFVVGNSYADSGDYRKSVHRLVDASVAEGLTPVLVVHAKDDRRAVDGFKRRYADAKVLDYFASKGNTPAGIIATVARMSKVVTSRYHGVIFSVLAGTPCQVIPGSPEKVTFLSREIGEGRLASASELAGVADEMRHRAKGNVRAVYDLVSKAKVARTRKGVRDTKVSVCMITLNDDMYLRKALASIPPNSQIGEILVVDGGSTDKTVSLLKSDGRVRFLHRPFPHDFSDQKNFCVSQAIHDWIVWMDADEVFPEQFWGSLNDLIASGHEAFWFPRENFIGSGSVPTNNIADDPDYQFRFFLRKCRWTGRVHENLIGYSGSPGKTDSVICHRKSRGRQDWNDEYYAWMKGDAEQRPSHGGRVETQ